MKMTEPLLGSQDTRSVRLCVRYRRTTQADHGAREPRHSSAPRTWCSQTIALAGGYIPKSVCGREQGEGQHASVRIWPCANQTSDLYGRVRPSLQYVADRSSIGIAQDDRSTTGPPPLLRRCWPGPGIPTSHATGTTRYKAHPYYRSSRCPH